MDIDQARTFLMVVETGSFVRAATALNVTQSTVSARIRTLEGQLGRPVFTRSKAGVSMTAAGVQFQRHAEALVRIWQQARQEVAMRPEQRLLLAVGAQHSLWDGVMLQWLCRIREAHPDIGLRAEVGPNDMLMRQVVDGLLDFAVLYTPQARPGLLLEQIFEETFVLVRNSSGGRDGAGDYIFVDWGVEFRASHAAAFPEGEGAGLFAGMGTLALDYILANGGSGYFPIRVVAPLIEAGRLQRVEGAPRFHRPAYLVHYPDDRNASLNLAIELLRDRARLAEDAGASLEAE